MAERVFVETELLLARKLPNFEIANVSLVDFEPYGRPDPMKSVGPCRARVDAEYPIVVVVKDLQNVAVARYENLWVELADLGPHIGGRPPALKTYMGYQNPNALGLEILKFGEGVTHRVVVDVAPNGFERLEGGYFVGQRERPDVAGTPYFVDLAQKFAKSLVEYSVGVRYDSNAFHEGKISAFSAMSGRQGDYFLVAMQQNDSSKRL